MKNYSILFISLCFLIGTSSQAYSQKLYRITIKTADKAGAGTDESVNFQIIGTKASMQNYKVHNTSGNSHERGSKDVLTFDLPDMGDLVGIYFKVDLQYSHFSPFLSSHWNPSWVLVEDLETGASYVCYNPTSLNDTTREDLRKVYKVTLHTGNDAHAGTDARVRFKLIFENGEESELKTCSKTDYNDLETGSNDSYHLLKTEYKGEVSRIKFYKDPKSPVYYKFKEDKWQIKGATVSYGPDQYWESNGENIYLYDQPNRPIKLPFFLGSVDDPLVTYVVDSEKITLEITTASGKYDGSNARVTAVIHGENGNSIEFDLNNEGNDRQKNKMDRYFLSNASGDLGAIKSISLKKFRKSGDRKGWAVRCVKVIYDGNEYESIHCTTGNKIRLRGDKPATTFQVQ